MDELFEEMKRHKLTYVFFHRDTFKVEIEGGEHIQTSSPGLMVKCLRAVGDAVGESSPLITAAEAAKRWGDTSLQNAIDEFNNKGA